VRRPDDAYEVIAAADASTDRSAGLVRSFDAVRLVEADGRGLSRHVRL
jgi:hypothetical protein